MIEQLKHHGMVSWIELVTDDVESAKRFYSELLGWTLEEIDCGGMPYTVIKANGADIGGFRAPMPQEQSAAPSWGAYITVDNVDGAAKRIEKLGGAVLVPPQDVPEVGRFCVLRDPQGAVLSLITYNKNIG